MKIAFAASECVPFAKTGGLADVAGGAALTADADDPEALARQCRAVLDDAALRAPRIDAGRARDLADCQLGLHGATNPPSWTFRKTI